MKQSVIVKFLKTFSLSSVFSLNLVLLVLLGLPSLVMAQGNNAANSSGKSGLSSATVTSIENIPSLLKLSVKQRDLIASPTEGMVIYNTDDKRPQYYNGTSWKFFDLSHHYMGEEYAGGIIFFIDASGEHGLVVAPFDQQTSAPWGFFEKPVGANSNAMGDGPINTTKIVKASQSRDIAARLCSDLALNGFSDWFLPSRDELELAYKNLKPKGFGNFANEEYWSSSETDFNNAWLMHFGFGMATESNVNSTVHVRAVRQF